MRAVIYDMQMNWLFDIEGYFTEGVVEYKEGGIVIPLIKVRVFGRTDTIACDYRLTYVRSGVREAYFKFNGKDYVQIALGDVPSNYHQSQHDSKTREKLMHYAKDMALTKPLGINQILETAITIILAILIVIVLIVGTGWVNALSSPPVVKILSKSVNSSISNQAIVINQSNACYRIMGNLSSTIRIIAKQNGVIA